MKHYRNLTVVALVISVCINAWLLFHYEVSKLDLVVTKGLSESYASQRDIALWLIPHLSKKLNQNELVSLIKAKYPDEPVNVVGNHVQWRLFNFWFENGLIKTVEVGS